MIEAGHRWEEVQSYTLPQIELFAQEAAISARQRLRDMAIAARATNAANKDFEKLMRSLDVEG